MTLPVDSDLTSLPQVARDTYLDTHDFVAARFSVSLAERLLSMPTQGLAGVFAAASTAAIYFSWIGFLRIWLDTATAAAGFLPVLMLAAGSGAMLAYRIAPRTGVARLPLIRDELNAELTRARR